MNANHERSHEVPRTEFHNHVTRHLILAGGTIGTCLQWRDRRRQLWHCVVLLCIRPKMYCERWRHWY